MRKCTVCGYTTTFVGECTRFKEHEDHCKTSRKTCIQKEREKYERDLEIMKAKFDKDIEKSIFKTKKNFKRMFQRSEKTLLTSENRVNK